MYACQNKQNDREKRGQNEPIITSNLNEIKKKKRFKRTTGKKWKEKLPVPRTINKYFPATHIEHQTSNLNYKWNWKEINQEGQCFLFGRLLARIKVIKTVTNNLIQIIVMQRFKYLA